MENSYAAVASEKEDYKLLQILQERAQYEPEAILAVLDEIEKRKLPVPNLEQLRQEALQAYHTQDKQLNPALPTPTTFTQKLKNFWQLFVPQGHYFVTPILILINISIFAALALAGVHVLSPEGEDLVAAGANFGPYTLTGEWWRLFTSMFLHIGIIHLLVNMYALSSIGGALEPLVGRKQFILAYVLAGLAGSLTSLWWDQFRISAGASGAIFGMFGMFMTLMLLEREMGWAEKKGVVYNLLGVIGFNLLFGLQSGIDNAAHTGGLLLGVVYGGVLMLRSDRYFAQDYGLRGSIVTTVLILGAFVGVYMLIPVTGAKYMTTIERFGEREQTAMLVMEDMEQTGNQTDGSRYLDGLEQGITLWDESIAELMALEELPDLGERESREVEIMLSYAHLRKKSYQMLRDDIKSNQPWMHPRQQQVLWAIGTFVQDLQDFREGKEATVYEAETLADMAIEEELKKLSPNARPLLVVDGEALENMPPDEIGSVTNPDAVESVTVLSGAEAVALYGEKAREGAVLIVTKKTSE